jgi:HK97 family phage portal protein
LHTPQHPLVGVSPLRFAMAANSINNSISRNQAAFFNNMSRPSGILSTEEKLTKEQMDALRNAWNERSRGMRAGEVPILTWGLKWQQMTITSEDAQLLEAYRMSIEDIARVFNVPTMLIGDYSKSTYNNNEQLMSHWLSHGLGFLLEHIEKSFAKFFKLPTNEIADFDVSALLRTDFTSRIDGLTKGIMGGLYSPNEARAREGLPSVEFGEEPRVQQQNVPLSAVGALPEAPPAPAAPPPAPAPEDEERGLKDIKQWLVREMAA